MARSTRGGGNLIRQKITAGPLPPPQDLQEYEDVLPGLADRITKLAEGHARNYWKNDRAQRITAISGQILGFLLGTMLIAGGIWLVSQGHEWIGVLTLGSVVLSIVSAFLKKR